MTTPSKRPYKRPPPRVPPPLGLRRADKSRPQVRLPLTGVPPDHPVSVDHLAAVPAWNGSTNLRYGTCMVCAEANSAVMTWRVLLGVDVSVSDQAVYDLYRLSGNPDFDPATGAGDRGCDPTVALAALVREGIALTMPDGAVEVHKPLCYGEVPVPPYEAMHATTAIFGGGVGAFALDMAQDGQTAKGVWDYAESPPWGGHACFCGAYTSGLGPGEVDESLVTWSKRVGTTASFVSHQMEGLYAIVWQPLWDSPGFIAGVDRAALAADFEAVTGRAFPVPVPPPPPAPEDGPLAAYLADPRLADWASRRHHGDNRYAAQRLTWLRGELA
jgi:hypothetical protein